MLLFYRSCSVAKLWVTLCNPVNCSTLGFPVLHYLLGLTGFNGRASHFFLLSRMNSSLPSPIHSSIHSLGSQSFSHLLTHSKKQNQNQNLQVGCQSHMLGANPEFLDLGLKPGQAWRAKGPYSLTSADLPHPHSPGTLSSDVKLIGERLPKS